MQRIYLDNSATTKPSDEVIKKMTESLNESWGNPSSIHSTGQQAKSVLDESREAVANFLNCEFTEVVFTSGGSESDNLAIRGVVNALPKLDQLPHVITSQIEHHAVLHTIEDLEKKGLVEATYLKPNQDGVISPELVVDSIKPNTVLVSIMYVNNETGVVNPIAQIGSKLKEKKIYFHSDAVQAAEWLSMNVQELNVDLLTFTGHKIHGPKGIGVLFVKKGTYLVPEITGGGHEFNKRAGTENVAAIAGLAEAVSEIGTQKSENRTQVELLRNKLEKGLSDRIDDVLVNGGKAVRSPHILNLSFKNAEGEAIILNLDFMGISASSGSACTSKSLEPSHVLRSMDVPIEYTHGSVRFSLSRETTEEEIDRVIEVMPGIISKLRAMSPLK